MPYLRFKGTSAGSTTVAPSVTTLPSITGAAVQGQTLTVNPGAYAGSPTPELFIQWQRGTTDIPGATGLTFVPTSSEIGFTLRVKVTANNGIGTAAEAFSPATPTVVAETVPGSTGDPYAAINAASFGMKTLAGTGSISSGSSTLTLTSNPGFVVGDQIIVENETGPGTIGVGGVWPALNYANATEMNTGGAAAAAGVGTYCFLRDTGKLYQSNGSSWTIFSSHATSNFYWDRAEPFSLVAKITAVNGTTLTLDKPAQLSVTGANVYFDNSPLMDPLGVSGGANAISNKTILFAAGTYCFSNRIVFNNRTGVTIAGAGKNDTVLKSPKNTPSISIQFTGSPYCHVRDLHMLGNSRDTGFGTGIKVTQSQTSNARDFTRCILFTNIAGGTSEANPNGTIKRVKATDPWTNVLGTQVAHHVWAYDVDVYCPGHRCYIQWMFQIADSTGGGARRCYVHADKMTASFESFRSNDTEYSECGGENCAVALNSPGNWLFRDFDITIADNAGIEAWHPNNSIVSINNNINPPATKIAEGGEWRNGNITILGDLGVGETGVTDRIPNPIAISTANPNVRITGTYKTGGTRGTITTPEGTGDAFGASRYGIVCDDATGTLVDGIRMIGGRTEGFSFHIHLGAAGTVKNCIVNDTTLIVAQTETNNLSNTDYVAASTAYTNWLAAVS